MSWDPGPPQRSVHRQGVNHGLHLVISLLTCGLWALTGWPIATILARRTRPTPRPGPFYPSRRPPPEGPAP